MDAQEGEATLGPMSRDTASPPVSHSICVLYVPQVTLQRILPHLGNWY